MPYQAQFSSTTLYSSSFREDYRSVVTPSPRTFIICIWVVPAWSLEARSLFTQWPKVEKVPFLKRCLGQLCNFLLTLEMREGEYAMVHIWLTKNVHMVENDKTLTNASTTLTPTHAPPRLSNLHILHLFETRGFKFHISLGGWTTICERFWKRFYSVFHSQECWGKQARRVEGDIIEKSCIVGIIEIILEIKCRDQYTDAFKYTDILMRLTYWCFPIVSSARVAGKAPSICICVFVYLCICAILSWCLSGSRKALCICICAFVFLRLYLCMAQVADYQLEGAKYGL